MRANNFEPYTMASFLASLRDRGPDLPHSQSGKPVLYRVTSSPHRAGIVVTDLIELVEHAVGERKPRLLPDEGFFMYHRYLVLKYRALMLVQNAERYTLPEFKRLLECLNAVLRIILSLDPVTPFSVPVVRIHPVKGNARLEDINQ